MPEKLQPKFLEESLYIQRDSIFKRLEMADQRKIKGKIVLPVNWFAFEEDRI